MANKLKFYSFHQLLSIWYSERFDDKIDRLLIRLCSTAILVVRGNIFLSLPTIAINHKSMITVLALSH